MPVTSKIQKIISQVEEVLEKLLKTDKNLDHIRNISITEDIDDNNSITYIAYNRDIIKMIQTK